jgi:hypothetical protein
MATVVHINPEEPQIELTADALLVHQARFTGTIVEVTNDLELQNDPARLGRLLTDAVEVGATVLRNGQSRALVESVALEIDRLVAAAGEESEKLPESLKKPLGEHLQTLSDLLAEHFDPKRARSLQRQLPTIVGEATGAELRKLVQEVLSESGAIGSQMKLFSSSNTDTLTRVNTILNRIEQKLQLDEQVERSVHKGRPFEEIVQAELEAIHGPLGDEVRCVRAEYGLLPKNNKGAKAGDYVVVLNPEHTRGREISYVIEAKTGPLAAAASKRELEAAIANRGAASGVLVFDGLPDAPLGGRSYMPHGDGRFTAVLDIDDGIPLAFEVACREARLSALATLQSEGQLDPAWLQSQCNRLCEVVEEASSILRSVSTVERGAGEIRERYTLMRKQALALVDEMRERVE